MLADAVESAVRMNIIEEQIARFLSQELCAPPHLQFGAGQVASQYLATHPNGAAALTSQLAHTLATRPSFGSTVHEGIERLADNSDIARLSIIPQLIDNMTSTLLSVRGDFENVSRLWEDIDRLKSLSEYSPYHSALAVAWPSDHCI